MECELCKFVIELVDKFVQNNRTEAAINSTLEKICNSLPGDIGKSVSIVIQIVELYPISVHILY